jgi:hypothetical protein
MSCAWSVFAESIAAAATTIHNILFFMGNFSFSAVIQVLIKVCAVLSSSVTERLLDSFRAIRSSQRIQV